MELTFTKTANGYIAEYSATTHFNLHIEGGGRVYLYKRTSGERGDLIASPSALRWGLMDGKTKMLRYDEEDTALHMAIATKHSWFALPPLHTRGGKACLGRN